MIIRLEQFNGLIPRVAPHLLPPANAQIATNCKLASGALAPWRATLFVQTPYKSGVKKSIYPYESVYWFHWREDVNAVRGPIAADAWRRAYWTSDGDVPRMTVFDVAVGGPDYPTSYYRLGIPPTPNKPNPVASGAPTTTDPRLFESRAYVYTFVSAYGEEGPPNLVSDIITWKPGQTVTVSSLANSPPVGNYNITKKRLYRLNQGSDSADYQFVAEIPIDTTSYVDNVASASLGHVLASTLWDPPPDDLVGLISLPNGCLAGISPGTKEVCFSEPYRPHAWPVNYRVPCEDRLVALGAYGASVLVTTRGFPVVLTGDPGAMSKERIETGQSCVSKRGLVDMGDVILYPSNDGLSAVSSGKIELVTEKILSREDWGRYKPSTISAYAWGNSYVGFYDNGTKQAGFIFDLQTGNWTDIDTYATAGYSDVDAGELYLVVSGQIVRFDRLNGSFLTYTWRSKPFFAPYPLNMGVGYVLADSYPVTAKVYADGVLKHTETVATAKPFRLPSGYRAEKWELELSGTSAINRAYLASTMDELREVLRQ